MIIDYLKGLGVIFAFVVYIFIFNVIRRRITGDDIVEAGIMASIFLPSAIIFLFPVAAIIIIGIGRLI